MCEFISWVNHKGTNYFLTDKDLKGKKFNEYKKYNSNWKEDITGHGAIRFFYPELKGVGVDKECTDFSSPSNFPKEIVEAIKNMEMTKFGVSVDLLTFKAQEEYNKIDKPAWEEYEKIRKPAHEEYEKIRKPAHEEYEKILKQAWEEYDKIRKPALEEYDKLDKPVWEEYEKITKPAQEEYEKIRKQAQEEYEKITKQALEEYEKIQKPASEEYRKIIFEALWNLFRDPKNRVKAWR